MSPSIQESQLIVWTAVSSPTHQKELASVLEAKNSSLNGWSAI